jgi:hypothetical protein
MCETVQLIPRESVNLIVMAKAAVTNLEQLVSRVHEQALKLDTLGAAIKLQFERIAQMQAELDLLPHARRRRHALRAVLAMAAPRNGDQRCQDDAVSFSTSRSVACV